MDLLEVESGDNPRHPWEICRLNFFSKLVAQTLPAKTHTKILDAGAGDGWLSQELSKKLSIEHKIVCWDANYTPEFLEQTKSTQHSGLEFSLDRPASTFDLILMLDVLEHVENDNLFLNRLVSENLIDGGTVVISVPAWSFLFSSHDRHLKHFRRYTPSAVRNLLTSNGLKVLRSGGLFHSLVLPRAFQIIRELCFKKFPENKGVGVWRGSPLTTKIIIAVLSADNKFSERLSRLGISVPGLSWWAVCQKIS
jgi:SAM-dependent methyltransferase